MLEFIRKILTRIAHIGSDPADSDDIRLRKTLLVYGAFMFIPVGLLWGGMYIAFGLPLPGLIPASYSIFLFITLIVFVFIRRYELFRFSQLILLLLLPFTLSIALGGFINSSAVILWSFLSPLGAMLLEDQRRAPRWFLAFFGLVVITGLIQSYLKLPIVLPINVLTLFFVMNILGVTTIATVLLLYFVFQKNLFQERSENLLLNILPKEIAQILQRENRTIADYYDGASILFADVVNFTPMSATMTPIELVELLNQVFSYFDELVERHGLEKIKTIGDCYMAAAGVPRPRPDHAQALTEMALEMRQYVEGNEICSRTLVFRFGINSGPVVAGVIGRKKFIYDLWGDAVNTASRMESHGEGGIIQITENTYNLIKDQYECQPRGLVNVKGKGEMPVWSVLNKIPDRVISASSKR